MERQNLEGENFKNHRNREKMYVTRPRSMYKKEPGSLSLPPSQGPNLGYLVIQDEEAETYSCFGLWKKKGISHFPFPQNKNLTVLYSESSGDGMIVYWDRVMFIPVLNQPLSSNRYYVVRRHGKHQGKASTSSKEEEMGTCFCCKYVKDVKARPLDPFNPYQQFEIIQRRCGFYAKSIAEDGFPPSFLRRKDWAVWSRTPHNYHLDEALGINTSLRAQLPDFGFPLSNDGSESVEIGKWYVPFMFVKEEMKLKDQMKTSVFYKMTLEQRWEKIFSKENSNGEENVVFVDSVVGRECAIAGGKEAAFDEGNISDGVLWFKSFEGKGGESSVGLSLAVVERMKWEQERGGWVGGNERQGRFEGEKFEGTGKWRKFGCYVLVESFVLKRMDESLVLTYDFRHTHLTRCKWE